MELKTAKAIAVEKCYLLQPYCDIVKIAGSVRRLKPDVHDIEIVVLPKTEKIKTDLFGTEKQVRSSEFISVAENLGTIIKGEGSGKMMQAQLKEKIMLDLFIPDDFDFYRQYAIRTGSADYARYTIATGWNKVGWVGSDVGLRKEQDCEGIKQPDGKRKWKCINPDAELPPHWQSEEEFFAWIKVKWLNPQLRN